MAGRVQTAAPSVQQYIDALNAKRLQSMVAENQRANLREAEDQWRQEDGERARRVGGNPAENAYFDRLNRRGRAAQAEAIMAGRPASSAVRAFQTYDDEGPSQPAGPGRVSQSPEPDNGINPTLANKMALERLKASELSNEARQFNLDQAKREANPSTQFFANRDAEWNLRTQLGARDAKAVPSDQLAEMAATRSADIKGKADSITADYDRQQLVKDYEVEQNNPVLKARADLQKQRDDAAYRRTVEQQSLKTIESILDPRNTQSDPEDQRWAMDTLYRILNGGKERPVASHGGTAAPPRPKGVPTNAVWDGSHWVER